MIIDTNLMRLTDGGRRALLAAMGWGGARQAEFARLAGIRKARLYYILRSTSPQLTEAEIDRITMAVHKLTGATLVEIFQALDGLREVSND